MTDIPSELNTKEQTEEQKAKAERMKQKYAQILGAHLINFSPEEEARLTAHRKSDERLRMEEQMRTKNVQQSAKQEERILVELGAQISKSDRSGKEVPNINSVLLRFLQWLKK